MKNCYKTPDIKLIALDNMMALCAASQEESKVSTERFTVGDESYDDWN